MRDLTLDDLCSFIYADTKSEKEKRRELFSGLFFTEDREIEESNYQAAAMLLQKALEMKNALQDHEITRQSLKAIGFNFRVKNLEEVYPDFALDFGFPAPEINLVKGSKLLPFIPSYEYFESFHYANERLSRYRKGYPIAFDYDSLFEKGIFVLKALQPYKDNQEGYRRALSDSLDMLINLHISDVAILSNHGGLERQTAPLNDLARLWLLLLDSFSKGLEPSLCEICGRPFLSLPRGKNDKHTCTPKHKKKRQREIQKGGNA